MMSRIAVTVLVLALVIPSGVVRAQQEFVGSLAAAPDRGPVGTRVVLTASGLPPSTAITVVWTTVESQWMLERYDGELTGLFTGRSLEEVQKPLATVTTGSDGRFTTTVQIPEDHGGVHDIYLTTGDRVLTKTAFRTIPAVTMTPGAGPLGTPIRFTITGLDPVNSLETWYWLLYDNKLVGYATAIRSRGTARFSIPATGEPGLHVLELFSGAPGAPYRAPDTSPLRVNIPLVFQFRFRLTEGKAILPPPIEAQAIKPTAGIEPPEASPVIWTDPSAAPVGAKAILHGKAFRPGDRVEILYYNVKGSRMTTDRAGASRNSGFLQYYEELGTTTAGADGRFVWPFAVPDMLGGEHRLAARVRGEEVAFATLFVHRVAFPLPSPTYRVGEEIVVHVKGVGWTEGDNIFAITYDNSYIGYACGFNSNGDVIVRIQASGTPGWHYIDLYPTFYRVKEYSKTMELPFLFRYPMLSWQDHPQPFVFRYAFQIVK